MSRVPDLNRLPHRGRPRLRPRAGAKAEFYPLAITHPLRLIFSKLSKLLILPKPPTISKQPRLIETPLSKRLNFIETEAFLD